MVQGMEMLFALFGGLAMFLYGMDRMSRALQRAAGDAMKPHRCWGCLPGWP